MKFKITEEVNLISFDPVVHREIKPTSTHSVEEVETIEGLPFYYYFDKRAAILLIVVGIIVMLCKFASLSSLIIPFFVKKYVCIKCKKRYYGLKNPRICRVCGGMVLTEEDYLENSQYAKDVDNVS